MTISTVAAFAVLLFLWSVVSGALARRDVTGPLVFAAAGFVLGNPDWGPVPVELNAASIHILAEAALGLVLFSDAVRVDVHALRRDPAIPIRLLGIGLPLTVIGGSVLASLLLDVPTGLAAFVGAALAPTDAALSVQVIDDERIPRRLRRALNVESGLNDGIATPLVTLALAISASQLGQVDEPASFEVSAALVELAKGLGIGIAMGIGGALVLNRAAEDHLIAVGGRRLAVLALAASALTLTLAVDGNGFIAAFVAGVAFGAAADRQLLDLDRSAELPVLGGEVLALVVWFLFGATLVPIAADHMGLAMVAYALLSLTIIRMVPVALSLVGARVDAPTTLFLAWFGPRGLASIVFALIAIEVLGEGDPAVDRAVATVALTVALSVILHGATAGPGGRQYLQRENPDAAVT
jgi:NhaP-type Na+/H+ or K+/H+ antiporter